MAKGTYNAVDNIAAARDLREKLILERADIRASLDYDEATGGIYWDMEDTERIEVELNIIARLIAALTNYLPAEESKPNE